MSTRFARMVDAQSHQRCDDSLLLSRAEAIKLLQREHAAVRKKVKGMIKECQHAAGCCCEYLLSWLDERGR